MLRSLIATIFIAIGAWGTVSAQEPPKAGAAAPITPPAGAAPAAAAALGGVQSANIFEVKPDASADPDYAKQTNAGRARVQPGNNAHMWRPVDAGATAASHIVRPSAPDIPGFARLRPDAPEF